MEKDIVFSDSIGRRIAGVVHRPEGSGPFPGVVIAHGFRSSKDRKTELARKLASSGIAALRFDFFGCGESDGKFEQTTIRKMLENLRFAVDYLAGLHFTDPDRMGLFGSSMGGLVAILQASSDSRIKTLVLVSPVSDIRTITAFRPGKVNLKQWQEVGFAQITDSRGDRFKLNYSFWEDGIKWDAYREARSIECPTLIIHGDKDERVPLTQSKQLFGVLKSEHKDLHVMEGTEHIYNPEENFKALEMAVEWFGRWL